VERGAREKRREARERSERERSESESDIDHYALFFSREKK
jgi:hypothetical protein